MSGQTAENSSENSTHTGKIVATNGTIDSNKTNGNDKNNNLDSKVINGVKNGSNHVSGDYLTNAELSRAASPLNDQKRMHRVVFTGGPCAGKTTAINRIKNFFENIGWKVLCVPETATLLLGAGIVFYELDSQTKINFQENLLKTLLQIESSINDVAKYFLNERHQNVIVIYDRGAMDPVAYLGPDEWEQLKVKNPEWNEVDLRDNRYDQIIHLITAANGAEQFYTLDNNITRTETIEVAREIDEKCSKAWIGHPCMDVIGNCTIFEMKVTRALSTVCARVGLNLKGFDAGNKKRKFLVKVLPDDSEFPNFQELNVVHNYLVSNMPNSQTRIRKSGQGGIWSYSYAVREKLADGQYLETRTQVDRREYSMLMKTVDSAHFTIYQKRRCFIWKNRYFRLDIYEEPCNPSCRGLILLSTRSIDDQDLVVPSFIKVERDVTSDQSYSMFNLSMKDNCK